MTTREVIWLAGIMEGEGSFFMRKAHGDKGANPIMSVQMCDEDVMARVSALLGIKMHRREPGPGGLRPSYQVAISGGRAVGWMLTLYTWLGQRRRAKITEILSTWKAQRTGSRLKTACKRGHEFTTENTAIRRQGKYQVRFCRACQRMWNARQGEAA